MNHCQLTEAAARVETILALLATYSELEQGIGLTIYWHCYQVLQKTADLRAATILTTDRTLLLNHAKLIDDTIA